VDVWNRAAVSYEEQPELGVQDGRGLRYDRRVRTPVLVGLLACSCSFSVPGGAPTDGHAGDDVGPNPPADTLDDAPEVTVPGRRRRITIDPTRVSGTHTGFPLWFVYQHEDLAERALPDGSDIHFRRPDGTPLPYEVQHWDKTDGSLAAWVRIDLTSTPTELDLVYGDPLLAHAPNAREVFSQGFAAVWHLESVTEVPDARGEHDGTPQGLTANMSVTAQLGRGVKLNGGAEQISFTNPITGNSPHTISLWVSQEATSDNDALVVLGSPACGQSRWFHSRYNVSTVAVGFYCNDWSNPQVNVIGAGWTLLHWVYAENESRLYRNGVPIERTHTHTPINTQGDTGWLGNAPLGWGVNMGAKATLDEVRIATTARSPEWIATEYANQSSPASFYSVGPISYP
jgi:hypothetical protein